MRLWPWRREWLIAAAKLGVAGLLLWSVGRHVHRAWHDLNARHERLSFDLGWLVASGMLYLAGLLAYGWFFECILRSSRTPVALGPALRAYVVSHLGKYVPGKAMVVVIRAGMVVPFGARASTAAIATFYETLVMMASGGLVSAVGLAREVGPAVVEVALPRGGRVGLPLYRTAALVGLGTGLAFLVLVLPPIFGRVVGLFTLPFPAVGPESSPRISMSLLGKGLLWSTVGWLLLGLSQLAVVRSFDQPGAQRLIDEGLVATVIASVALATVAGFVVAVLPGGLGVREGVLMSALGPAIGSDHAVVAALVLRLVWVAAELLGAAIFVLCFRAGRGGAIPAATGS
jgi:glycosyltransferase 2 family protein